jgi:hypothetical protein
VSDVEGHGRHEREKTVVVLRELRRAIIYVTKIMIMLLRVTGGYSS